MEVSAETGQVVQKWAPGKKQSGGDKLGSALKKISEDKKKRADLFEKTKGQLDQKKSEIENLFKEEVKRVKEKGIDNDLIKPFDLD